jgi:hypothetical protein
MKFAQAVSPTELNREPKPAANLNIFRVATRPGTTKVQLYPYWPFDQQTLPKISLILHQSGQN